MIKKIKLASFLLIAFSWPALAWDELPVKVGVDPKKAVEPGTQISGTYRLSAGVGDDVMLNKSNVLRDQFGLEGPNSRYVYGEGLYNNFDEKIYQQSVLNLKVTSGNGWSVAGQVVNDPWSLVGTTGDQYQSNDLGGENVRYNLKYFGASNSTIAETYRANTGDRINFPEIEVHNGHTARTPVEGFDDFDGVPGNNRGLVFTIPEKDVDYEYRPIRKLWVEYKQEDLWKVRLFAFADEKQAMTTDDPLVLSNNHAYWQWSPWLENYEPLQYFTDGSVKRGYYSNTTAYSARDSQGNRLVLLRGASVQVDNGQTFFGGTVAAPWTPWDERYFTPDNIPGAFRLKHQFTEQWMLGGVYTFRTGFVDSSVADSNQVFAIDSAYNFNEAVTLKGEVATSHQERDLLSGDRLNQTDNGGAYKLVLDNNYSHDYWGGGESAWQFSFAMMDKNFEPALSRYSNTRDDFFWGQHISFDKISDDLEAVKVGDGLDKNRYVLRARWKEKLFKDRFVNILDIRNVHKAENTAYKETVLRDEATVQITEKLAAKGMFRWQGLPATTPNVDPFLSNFYFDTGLVDISQATFRNTSVEADKDADRYTFSGGLQYVVNPQWTVEGVYERTNNIPDFPRGLLLDTFRDASSRVEGILLDRITPFLYNQGAFDAPPYDFFNIFRERILFRPDDHILVTMHAAQNGYKFAGGWDDNINHEGVSLQFTATEKLSFFADYTHSRQINVSRLISSGSALEDYQDHHNVYLSMDYKLNSNNVFRAEYGVFGLGSNAGVSNPYSVSSFTLPTLDTEHLLRLSLNGDF